MKPREWIHIGGMPGVDAVVCNVRESEQVDHAGHLEVVYLDDRKRAINVDVIWTGERWEFKNAGPDGGYADKYDRLREFVGILRRGRYR